VPQIAYYHLPIYVEIHPILLDLLISLLTLLCLIVIVIVSGEVLDGLFGQ